MDSIMKEANDFCAFTDLAMGIILLILTVFLAYTDTKKAKQKKSWVFLFLTLTLASFLGFVAHFVFVEGIMNQIVWVFLYPTFFIAVILLAVCAVSILKKESRPTKKDVFLCFGVGFVLYVAFILSKTFFKSADDIRLLTIFAGVYGLVGFVLLFVSALKKGNTGEKCIFLSFIPLLCGAYFEIQRDTLIHFIFYINHDGITHLFFILGLIVLFFAVRLCLKENENDKTT